MSNKYNLTATVRPTLTSLNGNTYATNMYFGVYRSGFLHFWNRHCISRKLSCIKWNWTIQRSVSIEVNKNWNIGMQRAWNTVREIAASRPSLFNAKHFETVEYWKRELLWRKASCAIAYWMMQIYLKLCEIAMKWFNA